MFYGYQLVYNIRTMSDHLHHTTITSMSTLALWHSSNVIHCINKVTLCRAGLVPGWLTFSGGYTISECNQPTQPCIYRVAKLSTSLKWPGFVCVKALRTTPHKICLIGDILPSQSLSLVLKGWLE